MITKYTEMQIKKALKKPRWSLKSLGQMGVASQLMLIFAAFGLSTIFLSHLKNRKKSKYLESM